MLQRMTILIFAESLCGGDGTGCGGTCPCLRKLWRIRPKVNHFQWNNSAVNFSYFAPKKREKNQGAKVQLSEMWIRNLIVSFFYPEKLHFHNFQNLAMWQCRGETFSHLLILCSTSPSRGCVFGTWNRHTFWGRGEGFPCMEVAEGSLQNNAGHKWSYKVIHSQSSWSCPSFENQACSA